MVWIIDDKRVKPIIKELRKRTITEAQARSKIKAIPPEDDQDFAFLDWEIDEAIAAGRAA